MPKVHRITDMRIDGAVTVAGPANSQQNVLVENLPASLEGDLDSHDFLGAIIKASPGTVLVNNIPLVATLLDDANPDKIGIVLHPKSIPTPATGSSKVSIYGGLGTLGGGLGSFGLSGMPGIGEIMQIGSQVVGQVMRTATTGGSGGMMIMNNMNPSNTPPGAGNTVTSANTGKTFTFSSYYSS